MQESEEALVPQIDFGRKRKQHNVQVGAGETESRVQSVEAQALTLDIKRPHAHGFVVGSARPLKDLKLPLLADVDQIMGVLQQDLTTVKLDGPLEHGGNAKLVPFGEAGAALKRFIVGEVQTETRGK